MSSEPKAQATNTMLACGPHGACSQATFVQRVNDYREHLSTSRAQTWGLYVEDTLEFACALFALLGEGREVILLPHAKEGLLQELSQSVDGWILSDDAGMPDAVTPESVAHTPTDSGSLPELNEETTLYFYTSGSTGKGKRVPKTWKQLTDEVAALEKLWGERAQGATFFSTVSHQHIYGFLFRLLWPLQTGRPFWSQNLLFPNDLQQHMQDQGKAVLISCPAHLQRMPDLFDIDVLQAHCTTIFSSGGLLPPDCAHRLEAEWKEPPIEVFGSTETGGVAHRQQHASDECSRWTPIPGVELRGEAPLMVRSPFVSNNADDRDGWFAMGDKVVLLDDRTFELRGRVDRIAKIEQKRISLTEMESRLRDHDYIETSAITVVPDPGDYHRTFLGAVMVLTDEGTAYCEAQSKLALTQLLKKHLLAHFERVTLPRKWLIAEALPANAQGKCTDEDLLGLFSQRHDPNVRLPTILKERRDENEVCLSCRVPEKLYYFEGHFDELPIVAGVVQMHWAMHYAKEHFKIAPDVTRMHAIKFNNVMFPQVEFELRLSHDPQAGTVQFSLKDGAKAYSSGRLTLVS